MVPGIFIILFLIAIGYFLLGVYVLIKNRNSLKNRMFFSLCIQLSAWALGYAFMVVAPTPFRANIWRLVACFGWCFFYTVWVDFSVLLVSENKRWMTDIRRAILYLPAFVFYFINLFSDPSNIIVKNKGLWVDRYPENIMGYFYIMYTILCSLKGIIAIFNWSRKTNLKSEKMQARFIVNIAIIAFTVGITVDTVLPFLDIHTAFYDIITFLILLPCTWYAINKYKTMFITIEAANEYILKTMNEPVIIIGHDLLVKEANYAALEKTGYREYEIIGLKITELILDIYNNFEIKNQELFKGNVKNYEISLVKKNKEHIPCLLSATNIFDNFKQIIGSACILYDITDRKSAEKILLDSHDELEKKVYERTAALVEEIFDRQKAEVDLKASEEKYKALVNQFHDGIMVSNCTDYRITTHNIRAEQILGLVKEDLENRSIKEWLCLYKPEIMNEIQQVITMKKEIKGRLNFINKKGTELNLEYVIIPISYSNQNYFMATLRDITEVLELEERKQEIAKMESLGTLAGGISHDFNNILAGLIGYTQLSLEELKEGKNPKENLNNILLLGERAKKLIRQILTFSKKTEIQLENVNIIPIIEEVITMLNITKPSNIKIKFLSLCASPHILADSSELSQLIMNLCVNATLAMQDKGGNLDILLEGVSLKSEQVVSGSTARNGSFIKLSVKDTGCGMDPSIKKRIFEPFYSTRTYQGGTGLGLAVVHGIVQRYGGWIDVESKIGKGSTFSVYLPEIQKEEYIVKCNEEEDIKNENVRILFIDDEVAIANSIKRILESGGYEVTALTNPEDAIVLLNKNAFDFDLIITDQSMPYMTGNELIQEVVKIRSDMPFILCSGYCFANDPNSVNQSFNIEFLSKPASKEDYFKAIKRILSKRAEV